MSTLPGPADAARYARRVALTARNVSEVVRFGGLHTDEQSAPYAVAAEQAMYRLRHYFADDVAPGATPMLLVPPLMITAEVWDVSPNSSAVAALHHAGIDPWVIDFGDPQVEPGGRQRDITDHVLAVGDAVDRVNAATGEDVVLGGYSQGGMFVYQAAAYRRGAGIDSLVTFGSPVDTTAPLPIPVAPDVVARLAGDLVDSGLLRHLSLPGWLWSFGFKLLTPAKSVGDRVQFLLALHDRDALLPRERQRRFLDSDGWTAYSGTAINDLLAQFVSQNRMLDGGFVIDDRLVSLADLELPILTVVGSRDTIGHPDSVRAISRAAPRAPVYETTLDTGHFGLVVGSNAEQISWPAVAGWVGWRAGRAELPAAIIPAEDVKAAASPRAGAAATALAQTAELGVGVGRVVIGTARRATRLARSLAREAPAQLPRLSRLEQLAGDSADTLISLGLLLAEQARRAPDDVVFLFGDRAYRQRDVTHRVDSVVKGLASVGVRPGTRVGVLMSTRPSAFTVVAALSRLGATAVLLRPDGDVVREARLAAVEWLISDPEHDAVAARVPDARRAVLGVGGAAQQLDPDSVDLELIDVETMDLPDWYRPNPHRAADVAFVLFTGAGKSTRALEVTNRRWAISALGTASAAALRPGDTIYSVTPIHHSSALLMSIGGAVAGGARFAMASAQDPDTFWAEVRRYGATHVSYTWTSLAPIVNAAPNPNEAHHPIRMFFGSGMPRNLWRRVTERFPGVQVLEFYASAQGEAILANLSGRRSGSMGRPLPGTAQVRLVAFDLDRRRIELSNQGRARECAVDEVGLLLVRTDADTDSGPDVAVLRGVFSDTDAWRSTGDLFLRDDSGDLWLVGAVADLIHTADGVVLPAGARFTLGTIPALDLVVTYGVPDGDAASLVAAVTVRPGTTLEASDLDRAVRHLPAAQRPRYVQALPSIPLTTWHRPLWEPLARRGVPTPARGRRMWRLAEDGAHYDLVT